MQKRKSAGFTVDDALWRRFKSKAADEGLPIGEMLVRFIGEYLKEKNVVKGEPRKTVTRRKLGTDGRKPRQALETGDREKEPDLLIRYAARYAISDPDEDSLREKVLDAIAKEYAKHAEDEGWVKSNLAMLEWHNGGGE